MAKKKVKDFIKGAIKRPGALTRRAKRAGKTTTEEASANAKTGTTLEKQQANFFLKVLKPASRKRSKSKSLLS